MKDTKQAILKTRIDLVTAEAFAAICTGEETTPSEMLRRLVVDTVRRHAFTSGALTVEVELGEPYGRGAALRDEYHVRAQILAQRPELIPELVSFLLPDFNVRGDEPFRVDSFYIHRHAMPNSRNEFGRFLGAKVVGGLWEGAIFLYRQEDIGRPENCFLEIRDALHQSIVEGLGVTVAVAQAPDLL